MNKNLLRVSVLAAIQVLSLSLSNCTTADGGTYEQLYNSAWGRGIDPRLVIQAPRSAVSVVSSPVFHGHALRVSIDRSDDFHNVANGTPRGEIAFARIFRFEPNTLYEIGWSTSIPSGYKFDSLQPELFTQVLQGPEGGLGPPPFSIRLVDGRYQVEIRSAAKAAPHVFVFGDPAADEGNVVHWKLRYRPDHAGTNAVSDLFMNGVNVVRCHGCGNAYANDRGAYLKMGIYKWWWQSRPSDVSVRTLYFGNVLVKRFLSK
ncbi:heparin lyase I family protein [Paraburkholderia tagetis]|uniref:Polysaccharide lyase n=1 Tax=Paraburkholderia tagetis TaxID=2913261 RepID=A0A9X1UDP2_9BURK|nr:heparin lyase I family protein [Paraburkholderia tagetis]MCG5072834.1 polysaccharide lyase [Paraburkholderia tagetis]